MVDRKSLIDVAIENGAIKAEVILQEQIVTDKAFWDICASNGCGRFGKYWTCPPAIGKPDELLAELKGYSHAMLYQTIGDIEDSFDIEGMIEVGHNHEEVSRRIHAAANTLFAGEKFLHLSSGGCYLCERCAKQDDLPCRFPDEALAPMEGYCIDVYKTSTNTDLKYINGTNTVTYFGIILFTETENV